MSHILPATEPPKHTTDFIEDVCNDNYILVVGSEVMLRKDGDFEPYNGDSNDYILHLLKEKDEDLSEKKKAKIKSLNDYMGTLVDGEKNLCKMFSEDNRKIEDMAPELVAFLNTGIFKFVMTTTIDDYVEKLMKQIFGENNLRVVCFGDESWKALKHNMDSLAEGETYKEPTLVYVFGKVSDNSRTSFVKDDNDAIVFVKDWLKESGAVVDYIKSKKIVALGCKFENWYFRFLWYILKRKFVNPRDKDGGGEVAISFDDEDVSDLRLKSYLEQNKIKLHPDAREFMRDISMQFEPEAQKLLDPKLQEAIRTKRSMGGIFLSYKSKNFAFTYKLFNKLKLLGYEVWFDYDKLRGGYYEEIIANAIHKAKVFVAILSLDVAKDLEEGHTSNYYNREWKEAVELGEKDKVIPLAIDGYSLRASYHNAFKSIISLTDEKKIDGFDLMEAGNYSKFIKRINELLKIK